MLFNSLIFAVFAPAFFVVYNLVKKDQRLKYIVDGLNQKNTL